MPFDSHRTHEVPDDLLAAIDYCYEQGWTDGLPVIPPVVDRVHAMLMCEGRPPESVITHPTTGLQLTVHAAAVNAVMAGCLPEYFRWWLPRSRQWTSRASTSMVPQPAQAARRRC